MKNEKLTVRTDVLMARLKTWKDHVDAWDRFGRIAEGAIWGRAAVAASISNESKYGEGSAKKFAAEVGQTVGRIWLLAQAHEAYPENSCRHENLSFQHHVYAMYALDPAAALAMAEEKEWSANELRAYLKQSNMLPPVKPLEGVYSTLVIDPPWEIEKIDREVRPKQGAVDYPMMSLEELAALPVSTRAAADAHLYLWTTHKYLPAAFGLVAGWGFNYQCLMTWVKNVGFTPFSWMYSTEHVLFCRRGSLDLLRKGLRLDFAAPVTKHSEKPDVFYDLVRQASPEPRVDMFARKAREGFTVWGNEAPAEEAV